MAENLLAYGFISEYHDADSVEERLPQLID
jgi:hypothetical protein